VSAARARSCCAALGLVVLALSLPPGPAGAAGTGASPATAPGLASTRTLVARLRAGRGEAAVTVTRGDPLGGPDRVDQGQVALEPPDRVRLDFAKTGERIALRGDGGEWVQPAAKQLVRIRREQAGLATWLWEVFLAGGSEAFAERSSGERRFTLEPRTYEVAPESAVQATA